MERAHDGWKQTLPRGPQSSDCLQDLLVFPTHTVLGTLGVHVHEGS